MGRLWFEKEGTLYHMLTTLVTIMHAAVIHSKQLFKK